MTWDEFLARADVIGGDVEVVEDGHIYRGPIAAIELVNGNIISIKSGWVARFDRRKERWVGPLPSEMDIRVDSFARHPSYIGFGRINFHTPNAGDCTIFLRGGGKLTHNDLLPLEK